ncbi:MAG: hypothetical protein WC989_01905 [Micavibrio sp.]
MADPSAVIEDNAVDAESVTSQGDGIGGPQFATEEAVDPVTAAEDGEGGGLPQLDIGTYPSQIFWLLVMFAALYVAFSKSILPAISGVVEGRENLIKGNLNEAERLRQEALSVRDAYESNLEAAKVRATQAVQDVELGAKKQAAEQLESFRRRAAEESGAAETRVIAAKERAMGDMASVAAEVASLAAEKITGINMDVQKAKAIVDSITGKAEAA